MYCPEEGLDHFRFHSKDLLRSSDKKEDEWFKIK